MSCFVGEVGEAFIGASGLRPAPGDVRSIAVVTVVLLALLLTAAVEGQSRAQQPPTRADRESPGTDGRRIEAQRPPALRKVSLQFLDVANSARIVTNDPSPPALTTCSGGMAGTYPCSNVDLMSLLALADIGGGSANDIWGWTDSSTGKEYAIMGRTNGTSFVDISDPVNPIYLGNLPPHSDDSPWRDIKVYADHAFIVTKATNSGMQVFDLTQLRMVASPPVTFSETAHYSNFSDAHNLAINENSGFAYAVGTNHCSGGLHMINIQTPTNPTFAGCFSADGFTHDAQCVNYDGPDLDHQGKKICFNSNVDTLTIVDVTNKADPAMLSRTGYSGSRYTHQGWLTEDQAYFLLGDELDETDDPDVTNTRTYMWDVSDLDDPALIGSHDSTTTATDHNQYVKGNYTYQSNYRAGLRILDITGIANGNLSEEAFFDVYPGSDSPDYDGAWSNYPFFDSGIVIVSVIEQGLFILRPSLSGAPVPATVPDAPRNLLADGGNEQVALSWDAPEDDGGTAITDYEYQIDQTGEWISIGSTDTTHTVADLVNGTAYAFQVRAVNAAGNSAPSNQTEATPELFTLDFAHFANGEGITSGLVFVNVATHPIRLGLDFYDKEGNPIAADTVVDVTEDLEITEDGSLSVRTAMEPLGELTISTHGRGEVMSGSVKVFSNGPIGGVLRFGLPDIGVAGVGASPLVQDALFPARRRAGGISTAAAIRNLGAEAMDVSCRLMEAGSVLEAVAIPLEANGQDARFIEEMFTGTDTSDLVGSVRCLAPGQFTGIAVELDAGNRIFTTLPVVAVDPSVGGGGETVLDFAHFANGAGITSELVFVNRSTQPSRPAPTHLHSDILPNLPVLYFYDQGGDLIDPESVVDVTGDLVVTEDGALTVQTEIEPLGVLTILTHGRGDLLSGSVKVTSDRPIGGFLRFDLPGIGVTGVGASLPLRDAIFPARRQTGGISTAAAIRNLEAEAMVVSCRLMKDGAVLEEVEIPLAANGQEAQYIEEMFTGTGADLPDFVGAVRCMAPSEGEGMFTGVAVELDAGNQIFTTLPVVPVQR